MATIFTQQDFLDGKCKHQEIGNEAEPRWSSADARRGLCSETAVGTYREVLSTLPQANANALEIVQQALNQVGAQEMAAYLADRLDILAPKVAQLGLNGLVKDDKQPVKFEDLTTDDLDAMSSTDIKRLLLASEGITTKAQVEALKQSK